MANDIRAIMHQVKIRRWVKTRRACNVAALFGVLALSACAQSSRVRVGGEDYFAMEGTPKGIAAAMDGMNGMITNGKASPDKDTAHWIARKAEEKEITARETAPSWMSDILGGGAK